MLDLLLSLSLLMPVGLRKRERILQTLVKDYLHILVLRSGMNIPCNYEMTYDFDFFREFKTVS